MNADRILRVIDSIGGKADEDQLTALVPEERREGVRDTLRSMENSGLLEAERRTTFRLSRAGGLRLLTRMSGKARA